MAVYAAPLAAILLVRLHTVEARRWAGGAALGLAWVALLAGAGMGLAAHAARGETAHVRGPGGSLATTPALAPGYQAAASFLARESAPGSAVLVAPQMTWLYSLAERRNALPELTLLPGALDGAAAERAATARLDRAGVRAAVVDARDFSVYGQGSFGRSFDRLVARWLETRFALVKTLRTGGPGAPVIELWKRRTR
jgi:hypothetical protein